MRIDEALTGNMMRIDEALTRNMMRMYEALTGNMMRGYEALTGKMVQRLETGLSRESRLIDMDIIVGGKGMSWRRARGVVDSRSINGMRASGRMGNQRSGMNSLNVLVERG